jgi:phytoene synthase
MEALYAFLRLSDDLADEPGELETKCEQLRAWRCGLRAAIAGQQTHPIHPALVKVIAEYNVPLSLLEAALDGVETDLAPIAFQTFSDLYPYCFRVASAVGLACIRIWGFRAGVTARGVAEAEAAAEAAGIAFQLTNILRDVREDYERGRVYIPAEDLGRFGVLVEHWGQGRLGKAYQGLMDFQVARARDFYRRSQPLEQLLSSDGRAIFRVMSGSYQRLLSEIELDVERAFHRRARVPQWRKGLLLLEGWAAKLGVL